MGRAARIPVVKADSGSDDSAPEELNMSTGKDEAERVRREERESRKRIIAAAKEKRKKVSGPKEGKSKKRQKAEAQAAAADEPNVNNGEIKPDQQRASKAVTHGLLDNTIVKFLAEQEKKVVELKDSQPGEGELKKQKERKKKKRSTDLSSGRVKVVVLSEVQPKAPTFQSALDFRQNRLFGEGVHRSLVMLPRKVR